MFPTGATRCGDLGCNGRCDGSWQGCCGLRRLHVNRRLLHLLERFDDPNFAFTLCYFKLGNAGLGHEIDQSLKFAKVHDVEKTESCRSLTEFRHSLRRVGQGKLERCLIAMQSQPADHADRTIREKRCVAESFAGVHIGEMHFHKREFRDCQRVTVKPRWYG